MTASTAASTSPRPAAPQRLERPETPHRVEEECYSASSIFRGHGIVMKGKAPRDASFITRRIRGIRGDDHAACAACTPNMPFVVRTHRRGLAGGAAVWYAIRHAIRDFFRPLRQHARPVAPLTPIPEEAHA